MLLFIYSATIFAGSFLLFLIQPMITKIILPYLGGSPMVWNTAMLFFQTLLLAGYLYAHITARFLAPKKQAFFHLIIVILSLLLMPIGLIPLTSLDPSHMPVSWLLGTLALSVGVPYFLLSANATLTQHWFAHTTHPMAKNPYTLYVTSNLASFAGLLSFPFLIEPLLDFSKQSALWSGIYLGFACLIGLSLFALCRSYVPAEMAKTASTSHLSWRQRGLWVALAFIPSSLLQGVTSYLVADIASIPLLWIIPLALYLLTFMLAFSRFGARLSTACWLVMPTLIVVLMMLLVLPTVPMINFFAQLVLFFLLALACHGLLAGKRPEPVRLTEFYVWVSVGGALGGVFNALVAPAIFNSILEYPLTIAFLCLFFPVAAKSWKSHVKDTVPAILFAVFLSLILVLRHWPALTQSELNQDILMAVFLGLGIGLFSFIMLTSADKPSRMALAVLAFYFLLPLLANQNSVLLLERNFFGVIRISYSAESQATYFAHGTTLHGIQSSKPELKLQPQAYYSSISALPQYLKNDVREKPFAIIGLGAGTLACMGTKGQAADLYEIDPAVVEVAENPKYFTYLRDCPPTKNILIGDARLKLQDADSARYGLIVVDAYNSDALPLHLMTREALRLYLDKLAPGGVLAFHISNRNMNLAPTLARLAADTHLPAMEMFHKPPEEQTLLTPSHWVLMARDRKDFGTLAEADSPWKPLMATPGSVWTDHYSNILEAILAKK